MIKIFISSSYKDNKFLKLLTIRLRRDGIQLWTAEKEPALGVNLEEWITSIIKKTDYFIVILSKNSTNSKAVNFELSVIRLKEISQEQNIIIPVLIEDCEIPFLLRDRLFLDFRYSFNEGYVKLIKALKTQTTKKFQEADRQIDTFKPESYEFQIKNLKEAYNNGNLALFCGAGISFDAGIPTWNPLLKSLLGAVYSDNRDIPDLDTRLANLFQKKINVSPLILAQYLKTLLGKKFTSIVRDTLYKECNDESKIVDSISELTRQKRNRKSLKTIITFNFDDLIEVKLSKEKIEFKTIFTEGKRYREDQIPIYHPHGFLPRSKNLTSKNNVVLSEDAYHSQFIDPFSWSNLVQLNHLNNSTCLFIGISLTDPNMRRLLDVSIRKNGKGEKYHYILKKRYTMDELYPDSDTIKLIDKKVIPIIESIEEQDANNLGFNVIWINQFKEIPEILNEIGK